MRLLLGHILNGEYSGVEAMRGVGVTVLRGLTSKVYHGCILLVVPGQTAGAGITQFEVTVEQVVVVVLK